MKDILKLFFCYYLYVLMTISSNLNGQNIGDWSSYASDKSNSKYSQLDQINETNIQELELKWEWESPDNFLKDSFKYPVSIYQSTPIAIDGILYVSSSTAIVSAIDGVSGETLWTYNPEAYNSNAPPHGGFVHRGVSYWSDGNDGRIIVGTPDARLIALNADNGHLIDSFGQNGVVDLTKGLDREFDPSDYGVSTPPIITNDVVIVGSSITDINPSVKSPPGDVRGFDVKTGEQLWTFKTIPGKGEYGNNTWEDNSSQFVGNTNVWARMSADEELGYVYLPVSTPTNDWYGGDRKGDNLFAESLVCIDAKTGKRIWHYQIVHHGVWDYDLPAAPNLVDIKRGEGIVKAVAQVTKQGFTFVFNRITGDPIWPINEIKVDQSIVQGEQTSATQPFPSMPKPFERQGISKSDIIDFTPELFNEAWSKLKNIDLGQIYSPPTENGRAYLPGALGGANWHGAAVDKETGVLYVPSITYPSFIKLVKEKMSDSSVAYTSKIFSVKGPRELPLFKPPFGRITAINLKNGKHEWQVPMGVGPRDHEALRHLNLPRLGWNLRGSPLLTKTLLFIGQEGKYWEYVPALRGGSKLSLAQSEEIIRFEPKIQVYDKINGELLHELELPFNITGAPMTYLAGGKQFISFAVGGAIGPAKILTLGLK